MGRGGSDADIKKAFDSVDIDGSGLVEWNEFAFSMMGEEAMNYGPLANLEVLNDLLTDTGELLKGLRDSLEEVQKGNSERAAQNSELKNRLQTMKRQSNSAFAKMLGKIGNITGTNVMDMLSEAQIDKVLEETFKVIKFLRLIEKSGSFFRYTPSCVLEI